MNERSDANRCAAVWLTVGLAMGSVLILEHARAIPGFEPKTAMRWGAVLACPVLAVVGTFLSRRERIRRIALPILWGIVASPFLMTCIS